MPWTWHSEGKWLSRQTGGQSNYHKWHVSWKILSAEELETLPGGTKPRTSHHWSAGGKITWLWQPIFLEMTREGHCQSDNHWNHFKGNVRETFERQGETHNYISFSECTDTNLNWTIYMKSKGKGFREVLSCLFTQKYVGKGLEKCFYIRFVYLEVWRETI